MRSEISSTLTHRQLCETHHVAGLGILLDVCHRLLFLLLKLGTFALQFTLRLLK